MARVRDLWWSEVKGADGNVIKKKTSKHPDLGGNKDAKRWLAVWIGPDGREVTKAFGRKIDAKNYGDDQEADLRRGNYVAPADGKTKFGACFRSWVATREDPATVIRYESLYRLHIEPAFGNRDLGSIRPSEINTLIKGLKDRFEGTATAEGAYLIMNAVFTVAREDNLVVKNPVRTKAVERPKREDRKVIIWPDPVIHAIIEAHPDHLRAMPVLGGGCGLRAGEWFGLAREDVDLENGLIHVRRQVKKLGRAFVFAKPKNDRERDVPMGEWVAGYLAAQEGEQHIFDTALLAVITMSAACRRIFRTLNVAPEELHEQLLHILPTSIQEVASIRLPL
jgi:integrase